MDNNSRVNVAEILNICHGSKDPYENHLMYNVINAVSQSINAFTPIPQNVACECGKLVIFIYPYKEFHCTRCDREWELIVQVKQKKQKKDKR